VKQFEGERGRQFGEGLDEAQADLRVLSGGFREGSFDAAGLPGVGRQRAEDFGGLDVVGALDNHADEDGDRLGSAAGAEGEGRVPADRGVTVLEGGCEEHGGPVVGDLGEGQDRAASDLDVRRFQSGGKAGGDVVVGAGEGPAEGAGDVQVGFGQDRLGERRGGHVGGRGEDGLLAAGGVGRGEAVEEFDDAQDVLPAGGLGRVDRLEPLEEFPLAGEAALGGVDEVADEGGGRELGVVEDAADLAQGQAQGAQALDVEDPADVGVGVFAVPPDGAAGGPHQSEGVVVPEHPGAHAGAARDLTD
jgi:hypothetical protein